MPRLLIVTPSAYTLSGLATWLDYLIPGLRSVGWEVTLGLVHGPVHHKPARYLAAHPCSSSISIYSGTGTTEGRDRALKRAFQRVQPDVVISVNIPDLCRVIQKMRALGEATPRCVMSNHGIMGALFEDAKQYAPVLDAVVATNQLALELMRLGGLPKERVMYASYGVDCEKTLSARVCPDEHAFRVLYSGRFERDQKRVQDLPLIMDKITRQRKATVCELAGSGPEEEALRQQFTAVNPEVKTVFSGFLSSAKVAQAYDRADALLVTSSWETGPIVIWEAMAAGVPVVSSRYMGSGLEGALKDGENCLLFDIGDTQGAADALLRLAEDAALADRLRRNAHALLLSRYSHEASVSLWNKALRHILTLPELAVPSFTPEAASGRLDHFLGARYAETFRIIVGKKVKHNNGGGEWPHTHNVFTKEQDGEFWNHAQEVDRLPLMDECR